MSKDINDLFELMSKMYSEMNSKFDAIDSKFDVIDSKFDAMDSRFTEIDSKFDAMDSRFTEIDSKFDNLSSDVKRIRNDVTKNSIMLEKLDSNVKLLAEGQEAFREQLGRNDAADKHTINERLELIEHAVTYMYKLSC